MSNIVYLTPTVAKYRAHMKIYVYINIYYTHITTLIITKSLYSKHGPNCSVERESTSIIPAFSEVLRITKSFSCPEDFVIMRAYCMSGSCGQQRYGINFRPAKVVIGVLRPGAP